MPRVRKNKIKRRSCSLCNKMGHNLRTCPAKNVFDELDIDVINTSAQEDSFEHFSFYNKPSENRPKVVVCENKKGIKTSPHIVNLRKTEENKQVVEVEPYVEESDEGKRVNVDFASMIRKANQKKEEKVQNKISAPVVLETKVQKKKTFVFKEKKQKNKNYPSRGKFTEMFGPTLSRLRSLRFPKLNLNIKSWFQNYSWKKLAYQSAAAFLLVAVPVPTVGFYKKIKNTESQILEGGKQAMIDLQSSTMSVLNSDVGSAQADLERSLGYFTNAQTLAQSNNKVLVGILKYIPFLGEKIRSQEDLLEAGHHLALANTYIVKGLSEATEDSNAYFTDKLELISKHLASAYPHYSAALENLDNVNPNAIPEEYKKDFISFKNLFTTFTQDMGDLAQLTDTLKLVLGGNDFKRYMVVFQNNNELRPTGGFVGSFAIIDVQRGNIQNIDVPSGGSYDLQGQLDAYVKPPLPLQLVNGRWEFQDSNWFPDFPASAQKMAWFYEHSRGATVDGVIAVNASVFEDLLKILGAVSSEKHNLELTSENAIADLQYQVEKNYNKDENKPKEVIGELMTDIFNKMSKLSPMDMVKVLTIFHTAFKDKEAQAFFFDRSLEKTIREFGWSGEINSINDGQDYLSVINSNMQGQKSDAKIKQNIKQEVFVQKDGSIINKIIINKRHTGVAGEIFSGVANISYLRLYVPAGSQLLEAGGFEYPPEEAFHVPEDWYQDDLHISQFETEVGVDMKNGTRIVNEFGKTSFGNWMITYPGNESEVYFIYKLPFKISYVRDENIDKGVLESVLASTDKRLKYSLVIQKQSGVESGFSFAIKLPEDWSFTWNSGNTQLFETNLLQHSSLLQSDMVLGAVIKGQINK